MSIAPPTVIMEDKDGNQFRCTLEQANTLKALSEANKGGFATVIGYRPSSGYIKPSLVDYQIITRFSYVNLLQRQRDAMEGITWNDIKADCLADAKIAAAIKEQGEEAIRAIFNERKGKQLGSISTTLQGKRDDAHRQAHDRCYARITEGVRVHFETHDVNGQKDPILTDGLPTAQSIMLDALFLNTNVREPGEKKVVNSGVPVLIGNIIESKLNQRSVGFRSLSLKPGNFEAVRIGGKVLNEADTARFAGVL